MSIKILGRVVSAGEQILTVATANGGSKALPLAEAAGAVLVSAATEEAAERVMAVTNHLAGKGSLRDAIAAHCPALPAKSLALTLTVVNWATSSIGDNGKIDPQDYLELLPLLAKEAASE